MGKQFQLELITIFDYYMLLRLHHSPAQLPLIIELMNKTTPDDHLENLPLTALSPLLRDFASALEEFFNAFDPNGPVEDALAIARKEWEKGHGTKNTD